jgi:phosphotransferase system enzyme I (PtsI)
MLLHGVGVSPGKAAGPVALVAEPLSEPPNMPAPADPAAEASRIRTAAEQVSATFFTQAGHAAGTAKQLLETTAMMAADPALLAKAEELVTARNLPAARAVYEAAAEFADALRGAGGYLAARVRDVQDVRDRIVANLLGLRQPGVPELSGPSVLIARDLAPSDTATLDRTKVLALVTEEGGPTSHTAILARSLGIPAVVACRGVLASGASGLIVDGEAGTVEVHTDQVEVVAAQPIARPDWHGVGVTADGYRVRILANVGSPIDAKAAIEAGAEGIGLFRTEFCYLNAANEPSIEEQRAAYAAVLAPFHGKPVVVRTLDAGADKPLAFLDPEPEPNPALGVRGLRVSQSRVDVLDRQLAAIAGAAADSGAEVAVMAPMVATPEEASWFAERVHQAGITSAGVMIEVPSAALLVAEILDAVDFVSAGTNDLAQYTMAADRQLGAVAAFNDPWQPAVLRLLAMIGNAAAKSGKPAGVCGEAAADPLLALVLVGMGMSSLSMNSAAVEGVGAALAGVTEDTCRLAAEAVLSTHTAAQARANAQATLG